MRRLFWLMLLGLAVAGAGGLGVVMLRSLEPTDRERDAASVLVEVGVVSAGEVKRVYVERFGRDLLIFRPTAEAIADLKFMDDKVWDPKWRSYDSGAGLFIYWGESTKLSQPLEHKPKGSGVFSNPRKRWLGGFVDTWHDPSYDYAGRTIKDSDLAFYGYNGEHPNLRAPKWQFEPDGRLLIIHP